MAKDKKKNKAYFENCTFNNSQVNNGGNEDVLDNSAKEIKEVPMEQHNLKKRDRGFGKGLKIIGILADLKTLFPKLFGIISILGIGIVMSIYSVFKESLNIETEVTENAIIEEQDSIQQMSIIDEDEERSTEEPPVNVDEEKLISDDVVEDNAEELEEVDSYYEPKWDEEVELINFNEMQSISVDEKVESCAVAFDRKIKQRMEQVHLSEEMPEMYETYVLKANEIYEGYDEKFTYDEKQEIVIDAADTRDMAKREYRQESNEQIVGNYYAKCGITAQESGFIDQEFKYYQNAINYYYDAYAVSIKNSNVKNSALEYMATCFYNISRIEAVDTSVKEEALISAIMLYQKFGEASDNRQLVTNLNIGRAYTNLCKLTEADTDKYFYFQNAVEYYEKCYNDTKCGEKMTPIVYSELMATYQYCFDYIDESVYPEDVSKEKIRKKHDEYYKLRKRYE